MIFLKFNLLIFIFSFFLVILLLLVVQAAALPVGHTRSNDDGFNRKECGDDDKYHMKRMREFEPKLNTVRKSIGKVALDAAIEGQSRLCNQSALWKVELPVFRAGRSTAVCIFRFHHTI